MGIDGNTANVVIEKINQGNTANEFTDMMDQESQLMLAMGTAPTELMTTAVDKLINQQFCVGETSYLQELTPKDITNRDEGCNQVVCYKVDVSNCEGNVQGGIQKLG